MITFRRPRRGSLLDAACGSAVGVLRREDSSTASA